MLNGGRHRFEGKTVALIHPAWHSCGSHTVFCSQAAAYRAMGARVVSLAVGTSPTQGSRNRRFWSHYYKMSADLVASTRHHTGPSRYTLLFNRSRLQRAMELLRSDYATQMAGLAELSPIPAELVNQERIDLIHCNHYFNMPLALRLKARTGASILLETHDVQSRQYDLRGAQGLFSRQKSSLTQMEASELALVEKADCLAHINADEHAFFQARLPGHKHVLLYPALQARKQLDQRHFFLVVASANYPNYLSVSWLLERVLPAADPVRLVIVGNVDNEMKARSPGLYLRHQTAFKGRVDDLQQYYSTAATVLLPVVAGHGLAIKTVEALESGAPLIATRMAFRGMAVDLAKIDNLHLADTPDAFARHINKLRAAAAQTPGVGLDDSRLTWREWMEWQEEQTHRMASASRRVFDELFSFPRYIEKLEDVACTLLAGGEVARTHIGPRAGVTPVAGLRQAAALAPEA